jgi:hypothetical protein
MYSSNALRKMLKMVHNPPKVSRSHSLRRKKGTAPLPSGLLACLLGVQGDQIGRIFAYWLTVFFV